MPKKTEDFYKDLAKRESTNNPKAENRLGYIGSYQMGEAALVDSGYYNPKPLKAGQKSGTQYNNDWSGTWTGKNGIHSKEDFKNHAEVQDKAAKEYHQLVYSRQHYDKYEGKTINGIVLTKSGMIAAAHLVGEKDFKTFLESNGAVVPPDGNHIPCTDYLKQFSGYEVDFSGGGAASAAGGGLAALRSAELGSSCHFSAGGTAAGTIDNFNYGTAEDITESLDAAEAGASCEFSTDLSGGVIGEVNNDF